MTSLSTAFRHFLIPVTYFWTEEHFTVFQSSGDTETAWSAVTWARSCYQILERNVICDNKCYRSFGNAENKSQQFREANYF